MNSKYQIIDFPEHADIRGSLVPFELNDDFPFLVKRVYLVTAVDEFVKRGGHAHLVEDELFVAVSGTLKAIVNDGTGDTEIILNRKNKGLLVQTYCWHEFFAFSSDAVLLCFSSTHYLPGDQNYIIDKNTFLKEMNC